MLTTKGLFVVHSLVVSAWWQLALCFLFERTRLRTAVWFADGNVDRGYRHNIKSLFAEWLRKQCGN